MCIRDRNDAELAEQAAEAKAEEAERAKRDEMLAEMEAEAQSEHDASNVEVINEKKNERKRHEKDEHTLLLRIFRKLLKIDSYETYILPFVMFLFLGVVICPENE